MREKPFFAEVFESFQAWAQEQLKTVPELKGVTLVADWTGDAPTGATVLRLSTPGSIRGLLRQGKKMTKRLETELDKILAQIDQDAIKQIQNSSTPSRENSA